MDESEIRRIDTLLTTPLFKLARILRRVLETWHCHSLTPVKDHQLKLVWKTRKKWNNDNFGDFENQAYQLIQARKPGQVIRRKSQMISWILSFEQIINKSERWRKTELIHGPCWRAEKLREILVTVIPTVVGKIHKNLQKRKGKLVIRTKIETIQTTAVANRLLQLEESWITEETCCHSDAKKKKKNFKSLSISKNPL